MPIPKLCISNQTNDIYDLKLELIKVYQVNINNNDDFFIYLFDHLHV